jgi:beta-glucosidase
MPAGTEEERSRTLEIEEPSTPATPAPDVAERLKLAGNKAAAALYLRYPEAAGEPPLVLRGFAKTAVLVPGASARVSFELKARDFAVYDEAAAGWRVVRGEFGLVVGASSRDARLECTVAV